VEWAVNRGRRHVGVAAAAAAFISCCLSAQQPWRFENLSICFAGISIPRQRLAVPAENLENKHITRGGEIAGGDGSNGSYPGVWAIRHQDAKRNLEQPARRGDWPAIVTPARKSQQARASSESGMAWRWRLPSVIWRRAAS
jgi:hypothetical protein